MLPTGSANVLLWPPNKRNVLGFFFFKQLRGIICIYVFEPFVMFFHGCKRRLVVKKESELLNAFYRM